MSCFGLTKSADKGLWCGPYKTQNHPVIMNLKKKVLVLLLFVSQKVHAGYIFLSVSKPPFWKLLIMLSLLFQIYSACFMLANILCNFGVQMQKCALSRLSSPPVSTSPRALPPPIPPCPFLTPPPFL